MRSRISGLVVTSLVVVVGLMGYGCAGTPKNPTTAKQVEEKVQDGVPAGSSRSKVEAWLTSQEIEFRHDDKPKPDSTAVKKSQLDPEAIGGILTGFILDTRRDPFVRWSIMIHFYFDKEDMLIKYLVDQVGTGL